MYNEIFIIFKTISFINSFLKLLFILYTNFFIKYMFATKIF